MACKTISMTISINTKYLIPYNKKIEHNTIHLSYIINKTKSIPLLLCIEQYIYITNNYHE